MYPTRLQVKNRYLQRLDDPAASVFTEAVFTQAFGEAYDAMYQAFLLMQCPRIELVTTVTVPIGTTSLTPAEMSIADFGDFIYLAERLSGSTDPYIDMVPVDRLSQRAANERLVEFNWRNNTFYFLGATTIRELQVKYDGSGEAPTDDATVIQVDSCLTFLSNYAVGVSGGQKGYDDTARRCMALAVGPRYDSGVIGGELWRLMVPDVRSRQNVVVAPRPFSARRRMTQGTQWAVPYVAAQQGTTGGGSQNVPVQYSTDAGTIVPVPDGTTRIFYLQDGVISVSVVAWNGLTQTEGVDYTRVGNQVTFIGTPFPTTGDTITAEAYQRVQ